MGTTKKPQHKTKLSPDAAVAEKEKRATEPPQYQVWMLNDDFTPMEFVVKILKQCFSKEHNEAYAIMLKVHLEGRALCGIYPKDLAETKVAQVTTIARQNGHPLRCTTEVI